MRELRKKPNGGPNFYACLTVTKALRARAGKAEPWRSLGTANPTLASKLYGAAIEALERELVALVAEPDLRDQAERNRVTSEPISDLPRSAARQSSNRVEGENQSMLGSKHRSAAYCPETP